MSALDDIRMKLTTHLSELEQEIESLRTALGALDASAAQASASDPHPPASRRRSAAARRGRGRESEPARRHSAELERLLAQTGGQEAVELARETGIDPAAVLARIDELERAGRSR